MANTPLLLRLQKSDPSILWRAIGLIVLVILFQVVVAHVQLSSPAKRRWQHALTGHALVQISYVLPYPICVAALLLGAVSLWTVQQVAPTAFYQAFGPLLRPDEVHGRKLPGAFYFLVGTAVAALWTGDEHLAVARYAVECLALADPMASWVGSTISSRRICSGSSLSGCIACFVTAWCVGNVMLKGYDNQHPPTVFLLSIGALTCTLAEAIPFGNDNLNIPIATTWVVLQFYKKN
jgi:dolichol kinase